MTARYPSGTGRKILFWAEQTGSPAMDHLLGFFGVVLRGDPKYGDPKKYIRTDIPYDDRQAVAKALKLRTGPEMAANYDGGDVLMGYMGFAECRICKERLGTRDLFGYGFVWPEKAEHYILNHNVWTPDCDDFLVAVRQRAR